jgi:hypothetical protein
VTQKFRQGLQLLLDGEQREEVSENLNPISRSLFFLREHDFNQNFKQFRQFVNIHLNLLHRSRSLEMCSYFLVALADASSDVAQILANFRITSTPSALCICLTILLSN